MSQYLRASSLKSGLWYFEGTIVDYPQAPTRESRAVLLANSKGLWWGATAMGSCRRPRRCLERSVRNLERLDLQEAARVVRW